jgi:GST-like protein
VGDDDYTIADMAIWPWYRALAKGQLHEAGEFLRGNDCPHAARRGRAGPARC